MTDKQIADILSNIIVLIDTREKKNDHILEYFNENKIQYEHQALNSGDYSYKVNGNKYYNELISVERKNSLDEISQNFTKYRDRFKREFERAGNTKMAILIENATWKKLYNGSYRSKLDPHSFSASLLTWCMRYNCPILFCTKTESGRLIYDTIYYGLREILKKIQINT